MAVLSPIIIRASKESLLIVFFNFLLKFSISPFFRKFSILLEYDFNKILSKIFFSKPDIDLSVSSSIFSSNNPSIPFFIPIKS